MAIWTIKQSSADIEQLATDAGLEPVLARILAVRGIRSPQEARTFLHPETYQLPDPLGFRDMDKALAVAREALAQHRKCCVFGDYDADGVMSTVIMLRTLRELGGEAVYYIPQRESEGYGMNNAALDVLHQQGVQVIFACDNGISAFEQALYARELGMTMVILDHHAVTLDDEGRQVLPEAAAVVDAKRPDCTYPFKEYCAAGLCYRFSQALFTACGQDWRSLRQQLLPFATMATICDLVELIDDNRALVRCGLPLLHNSNNPGIRALISATGLDGKQIDTYHLGFVIGPCINASGRLDIADTAVELFLTDQAERAGQLAAQLVELNHQRRVLTEEGARLAFELVEKQELDKNKVIVLYCDEIQESVAGIIAGRVKERFYRPSVVLVGKGETLRGSCRSVEGYNIYLGLYSCRDLLPAFGGHPMAAGLAVGVADIPELQRRLNEDCQISLEDLQPSYRIDCPLLPSQAGLELARSLLQLAPYGKGNLCPLFAVKALRLTRTSLLGKNENVMRWYFRQPDGAGCEVIDFCHRDRLHNLLNEHFGNNLWQELLNGRPGRSVELDLIYQLNVNSYNGRETAQLQVIDFRLSESAANS